MKQRGLSKRGGWMLADLKRAFSDAEMAHNSRLVVWTKGQMRGVRAAIKRLGMA